MGGLEEDILESLKEELNTGDIRLLEQAEAIALSNMQKISARTLVKKPSKAQRPNLQKAQVKIHPVLHL